MRTITVFRLPVLFALSALLGGTAAAGAADATFTEIGRPGWTTVLLNDINESGRIVGEYYDGVASGGFTYDDGIYTTLLPPGWVSGRAQGINDAGVIVGSGSSGTGFSGWVHHGGVFDLIGPPGWPSSAARDVNNGGDIIGAGSDGGASTVSFLYDGAAGTYTLIKHPAHPMAQALAINDAGQVVGYAGDLVPAIGFLYEGGVYTAIRPPGWAAAAATDINGAGHIVGYGSLAPPLARTAGEAANALAPWRGFLFDGTAYTDLMPPGWISAQAYGINDRGQVVGSGIRADGMLVGFLYEDGAYRELASPASPEGLGIAGLNGRGRLLGQGVPAPVPVGADRAFASFRGYLIELEPFVDLKAFGEDGPVGVLAGDGLTVTAEVVAAAGTGRPADWWLFVLTPAGVRSYDPFARVWRPGFFPAGGFRLRDVGPLRVFDTPSLEPGPYTFYLGVDTVRNGRVNLRHLSYDVLTVFVY